MNWFIAQAAAIGATSEALVLFGLLLGGWGAFHDWRHTRRVTRMFAVDESLYRHPAGSELVDTQEIPAIEAPVVEYRQGCDCCACSLIAERREGGAA